MSRVLVMVFVLAGCASAGPTEPAAPARVAPTASRRAAARETPACRRARLAILAEVKRSQGRPCQADTACTTVTNPGSPVDEYRLVAHVEDAARLDRAAGAHLARCGAFHHYEPIDAIRVVEARCLRGRCQEQETVMHVTWRHAR
jgi:hypothetical protein